LGWISNPWYQFIGRPPAARRARSRARARERPTAAGRDGRNVTGAGVAAATRCAYISPMYRNHKIATCCYCGQRTVLQLAGPADRHALVCAGCGAPLRQMKALPRPAHDDPPRKPAKRGRAGPDLSAGNRHGEARRKPRKRRRKPLLRRVFDVIEDAAEEAFDLFD
jgi:hypothetical protein